MATHIVEEITLISDQILLMRGGVLLGSNTPNGWLQSAAPFVAEVPAGESGNTPAEFFRFPMYTTSMAEPSCTLSEKTPHPFLAQFSAARHWRISAPPLGCSRGEHYPAASQSAFCRLTSLPCHIHINQLLLLFYPRNFSSESVQFALAISDKKVIENRLEMTGDKIDYILEGINRYLMELAREQIRLAFEQAQKEVDDLRQRTKEGLQTARMAGKHIGMPEGKKVITKKSIAAKEDILKYSKDFGGTLNDTDCMKICGISHCTYYKYKKELKV